jgi:hypothetical protein
VNVSAVTPKTTVKEAVLNTLTGALLKTYVNVKQTGRTTAARLTLANVHQLVQLEIPVHVDQEPQIVTHVS